VEQRSCKTGSWPACKTVKRGGEDDIIFLLCDCPVRRTLDPLSGDAGLAHYRPPAVTARYRTALLSPVRPVVVACVLPSRDGTCAIGRGTLSEPCEHAVTRDCLSTALREKIAASLFLLAWQWLCCTKLASRFAVFVSGRVANGQTGTGRCDIICLYCRV
jgi:hypothetical protein